MKARLIMIVLGIPIFLMNCQTNPLWFEFTELTGEINLLVFASPDCPMCVSYEAPIKKMMQDEPDLNVIYVFSGNQYSKREIEKFMQSAGKGAKYYRDKEHHIAHNFKPQVTPHFFLVDSLYTVIYDGKFDDRAVDLGVYKKEFDTHYVQQALQEYREGKEPQIKQTTPVGCVFEQP